MIQVEVCILRKNLQTIKLNAITIIQSVKNKFMNNFLNSYRFATA